MTAIALNQKSPAAAAATPRKRIVFLGTAHDNGGSSILAGALAQRMREAGHDAEEWYLFGSQAQNTRHGAGPHRRVLCEGARSRSPAKLVALTAHLLTELHAHKPDAVFGLQSLSNLMTGFGGLLLRIPHRIATHHNPSDRLNPLLMRLDGIAGRLGVYTRVVACAEQVAASYRRGGPAYAKRLSVIANGQTAPRMISRAEARAFFDLPGDARVIGQIGRLSFQKNQDFTLDLLTADPDLTLLLIGSGPDEAALAARIAAQNLSDRVRHVRALHHEHIGHFYSAIDAVVFPSRFEGLSLAAIEAIHAGVPMLATDIPSFREMFAASPWATQNLLLPNDQPAVWTERLRLCCTDPAWRAQAHTAFADIAPQFSFDTMARRYLALLESDKNA